MITTEIMAKIAVNKNLLKEYDGSNDGRIVYLENGNEFQIQLFNPNTEPVAASISINNEKLKNLIIIRAGERIWLERYLDKAKKFKFETYEVEDNAASEKAIAYNGVVKVQFFEKKKESSSCQIYGYKISDNIDPNFLTVSSYTSPYITYIDTNYCTNSYCTNSISAGESCSGVHETLCACAANDVTTALGALECGTMETGRISEGSYSSQKFNTVNEEYNSWSFKEETIKILPLSRKPYTANDLEKIYCSECGRKLKTKFKYCPFCGTKIDY